MVDLSSHRPAGCPCGSSDGERSITQTFASYRFETRAGIVVESLNIIAGRTYTVCVRLPPLLKRRVHDADRNGIFCHIAQAGCFEELSEVPLGAPERRASPPTAGSII